MKSNKVMIASFVMLTGIGMSMVCCKKEQTVASAKSHKAEMTTDKSLEKTDPDEELYIRVRVKKKNSFSPVDNANVETFVYGTNVRINSQFTDSTGEAGQTIPAGIYYFHVTVSGTSVPYVTDTVHVNKNIISTVFVD